MRKSHLIAPVVAAFAFAWVIAHVGLPTLMEQVKAMRVALPLVLALSLLRLFLQTATWSASLKGEDISVGITKLVGVRLASQSMGYLTVLGPLISEPMKVKLLGTSSGPTITATFLDDGVYWFTSALLAIAGIVSLPLVAVHGKPTIRFRPSSFSDSLSSSSDGTLPSCPRGARFGHEAPDLARSCRAH